jgi:diguanylate cyclase (GGDEF)-like protein
MDIQEIVDLLGFDDKGRTYFALYSKKGGNLSGTALGPVIDKHNIFDALKDIISEDALKENQKNFANGAEGSLVFNAGKAEETLSYVPIQGTGWEMAVLIRESVIQNQIRDISEKNLRISRNQMIFTLVSVLLFAAVLLFQIGKLSQYKLEKEKETSRTFRNMANTDSLTGVKNKNAYTENEKIINQQIQAGLIEKLALVVADINGLKYVNDTQGHTAGDQLIKDACALICNYFIHGKVYRVGGDEFVVLLRGKGYDTMQEVIDELNRKVEENIKENDVVISIGYSILASEDQKLRDVFERADQMMYERKKELKSMGAMTSRL